MSLNIDPSTTTILLIDDNVNDRTYYADRIKFALPHCNVLEAKDGQSGLELYKSRRIDCIVTELFLPDMSGMEVLLEVIPRASRPVIAVIILTRAILPALADLTRRNGAQTVMVKRSTAGDDLVPAILKAIAKVGPARKDRRE